MDHRFEGPRYTVGVEEELMIVDSSSFELVSAIGEILGEEPPSGEVKPELLESVLEIATSPCPDVAAVASELAALRRFARDRAHEERLEIGAAGTHPFARWEDQRVVSDDRYRGLVHSLGFVARQELVFGMHVHVGMADPEEAIRVANGIRPHVPLLIALAANSPFWRGEPTGLVSSRVPIFRAFPRVGLPPRYHDWQDYVRRVEAMMRSGIIEDYTFLWYDVRPHPRLGTVEVRAMDAQTRVEHTVALAALVVSLARHLLEDAGAAPQADPPWEIVDENRWLAARHGLDAELVDHATGERAGARELAEGLLERLAPHGQDLGCERELEGVGDLLRAGNGALRQRMVYEANHDLRELMAEIVVASTVSGR
jgi:glutamate---cysteine ligase / carboxylate-amine ligase